ncbi:hypothetical protein SAY87_000849 [Trapa incisa]|uniref:Uncharacterized protein n=1 Tax=Trapa incisa TaxID=236973 RepID=A0AAN7GMT5_9MYRT|nr:hypothetical protein SAY87_000849 [Trapa incisa]
MTYLETMTGTERKLPQKLIVAWKLLHVEASAHQSEKEESWETSNLCIVRVVELSKEPISSSVKQGNAERRIKYT